MHDSIDARAFCAEKDLTQIAWKHLETDKAQSQTRFGGELAKGLGNRVNPGKMKEADNKISKRSHHSGSVSCSDARGVLLEGEVSDVVQPVLNAPVIAVQGEYPGRVGLAGIQGGQAVGDFFGSLVVFEMANFAADRKNLLDVGKIDVAVKLCAGPDLASFYPSVSFLDTLVLRGESCSGRAIRYLIAESADCL